VDEQSADLAVKLYGLLYKTENHIRVFVNRVMTTKFGVKWFELLEFKKAHADYEKTKVDFKRAVPCFNNIDDKLLSLTIDTLLEIINGIKIFDRSLEIAPDIQQKLIEKLILSNDNSLCQQMRELLTLKYDLWNDVFSPLFIDCPNIEQEMKNIIKNRNHIAHNKLIDRSAYIKMKENINTVKGFISKAEMRFDEIAVSDEMYETWEALDESERENKEYINQRIEDETGIIIRDEKSIFEYYSDYIYDLYITISDGEYFNNSVIISDYTKPKVVQTEQKIFSVKSNVKDEYGFDIFVQFDITGGQGEESNILIVAKNENKIILETTVQYRNGEAHEDYLECTYIPDSESFIDEGALKTFASELIEYVQDEMNEMKNEIDAMKYSVIKDGGELPIADIPCWSCCQEYISVDEDIYPYGKCINCGEYNELKKCGQCGSLYDSDEGNDFLCEYCKSKFESE